MRQLAQADWRPNGDGLGTIAASAAIPRMSDGSSAPGTAGFARSRVISNVVAAAGLGRAQTQDVVERSEPTIEDPRSKYPKPPFQKQIKIG